MTTTGEARAMLSQPVEAGSHGNPSGGRESMSPGAVPPVVLERRHWLAALAMLFVLFRSVASVKLLA